MARSYAFENYRVEVGLSDGANLIWFGPDRPEHERNMSRLRKLESDIKRLVSVLDNASGAGLAFDTKPVCEHCGASWTEVDSKYNGGCCPKDEAANPESNHT